MRLYSRASAYGRTRIEDKRQQVTEHWFPCEVLRLFESIDDKLADIHAALSDERADDFNNDL